MPWKGTDKMDEKKAFVFRRRSREETFAEICRKFGTSAKTGCKRLARFKERGAAGLAGLSRAPKNNANKIDAAVKKRLLKLKEKHKYWGAYKTLALCAAKYGGAPHKSFSRRRDTRGRKSGRGKRRRAACGRGRRRKSLMRCGRLISKGGGGRRGGKSARL